MRPMSVPQKSGQCPFETLLPLPLFSSPYSVHLQFSQPENKKSGSPAGEVEGGMATEFRANSGLLDPQSPADSFEVDHPPNSSKF